MKKRTLVMGIVNVTPDSFSDGGRWFAPEIAIEHGRRLMAEGADLVDVGGESTRPGSARVSAAEEARRVLPVIEGLTQAGVPVSVDTTRAEIAAQAVALGARIVNDVSGGLADPEMFAAVAETGADYVLMHWRGHAKEMAAQAHYGEVVAEVIAEVAAQVAQAEAAGIAPERVIVDPGIGFAKTAEHNWELLRHLDAWEPLGKRVLLGVSRKRFLGELLASDGEPRPAIERDAATAALTSWAAGRVWAVRTHEVRANADAVRVYQHLNAW